MIETYEATYIVLNKDETFVFSVDEFGGHLVYVEKTGGYISENNAYMLKKMIKRMKRMLGVEE